MKQIFKGKFRVTATYLQKGSAWSGGYHKGIDLVAVDDLTVCSPIKGYVTHAGWENASNHKQGFGKYISISDGKDKYFFCHLSSVNVKYGDTVNIGTAIGVEGSTGHSSGKHLHFEIRKNGNKSTLANPAAFIGIPNKLGLYDSGVDDELTEKEIRAIVRDEYNNIIKEVASQPESNWSIKEGHWLRATKAKIVDGTAPKSAITREQIIAILGRLKLL